MDASYIGRETRVQHFVGNRDLWVNIILEWMYFYSDIKFKRRTTQISRSRLKKS